MRIFFRNYFYCEICRINIIMYLLLWLIDINILEYYVDYEVFIDFYGSFFYLMNYVIYLLNFILI